MAKFTFDATSVEPAEDFELLPVGDYKAIITESVFKDTQSNPDNKYLSLKIQIVDGKSKGRVLFDNLNLIRSGNSDKDKTTVNIANKRLSAICRATGQMKLGDSSQLHNKPMLISVGIQAATEKYGESNTIKSYKSINGGSTLPQQQTEETQSEESSESWDDFISN